MQWFRLYNEFATDPKVQRLTEAMQRRLIMLFCFQSQGILQTLSDDDISYAMRISRNEWKKTKKNLQDLRFIDSDLNILNWDKRQRQSDNVNERVKRFRINKLNKECNVTETLQDSYNIEPRNVTETLQKRYCNGPDTDTDKTKITKVDRSSSTTEITTRQKFLSLLEPKFPSMMYQGYVNQKIFQMLNDWEKENVMPDDLQQAMNYVNEFKIQISSPIYFHQIAISFAKCRIKNGNYEEMKINNSKSNTLDYAAHNKKLLEDLKAELDAEEKQAVQNEQK